MSRTIKPFAEQGNYIAVHRILFDEVMPRLSPNAWKVLSLIVRKTIGWNKDFDIVAYPQIMDGTGIKGRGTVSAALHELQGMKPIKDGKKVKGWRRIQSMPELILAYH